MSDWRRKGCDRFVAAIINSMSSNIKKEGECLLCGKFGKLSFEHVPPKAAFNDKPIFIQTHEHLIDESSHLHGKRTRSNKGFGSYTLCESCNKLTGDWYARDFASFAQQGMLIISSLKPQQFISGNYSIKPLNVIKQISTMFLSADKSGHVRSLLSNFVLNKESNQFPNSLKFFLYSTLSPNKRMFGYSIIYDPNFGIQKWSEINFSPFGYLLAEDSNAAHEDMLDITSFSTYNYNEDANLSIRTRYLNVTKPLIGTYL